MVHDAGPADRAARRGCAGASPTPTPWSSATRTFRSTRTRGRLPDLQPGLARPSAAARRATRWAWRRSTTGASGSSSWSSTEGPGLDPRHAMDLSLFFAGTAGSVPTARRGLPGAARARGRRPAAVRLRRGHAAPAPALGRAAGARRVFLTHYHVDHWLGLPGMLKTFDLRGRERPLAVYGPPGPASAVRLPAARHRPARATRSSSWSSSRTTRSRFGTALVSPFPVEHRVTAYGYALVEDERPGALRRRAGRAARRRARAGLRAPAARGDGRRRPPRAGHGAAARRAGGSSISGDTAPCEAVEVYAHGADLLVHEATFLTDERARARETGHSTARQAAEIAREAGVRLLALTHLSTRYFPREVRDEARAVVPEPRSCRATSTRSRCRSPSAASPASSRPSTSPSSTLRRRSRGTLRCRRGALLRCPAGVL